MAEWVGKYHTQDRLIMSDPLFRQKALKNKRTQHYGSVLINIPVHYLVLTGGITALIIAVCLLFFFGQFSEKFVVRGYLNSSKGIVRVYPNKNGVIKKRFIHHGQFVQKGDPLFLIDTSSERMNQHRSILNNLIQQKQAIILSKNSRYHALEHESFCRIKAGQKKPRSNS